jgi:hypothetical protein
MAIAIRCIQKRGTRRSDWLNAGGTIRAVELSAPAITGDQPSEHERVALELLEAALHAMTVAVNPQARTHGAFNAASPVMQQQSGVSDATTCASVYQTTQPGRKYDSTIFGKQKKAGPPSTCAAQAGRRASDAKRRTSSSHPRS